MFGQKEKRLKAPRPARESDVQVGKMMFRAIMAVIRLAIMVILGFFLGLFACAYAIPILSATIAGITGVGYDTDLLDVCILLLLPSGAAAAIVIVGYIALIRRINRVLSDMVKKVCGRRDAKAAKKG